MRTRWSPSRRTLLRTGGASALLALAGCEPGKPGAGGSETGGLDTGGLDTGGLDTGGAGFEPYASLGEDCSELTQVRGLGPFYREGAPARTDLNIYGREGTRVRIYVEVVDQDCLPVPGALVEVWHCGPDEQYEMEDPELPYRTALTADDDGRLWFETIEPPPYLDVNGLMRPHIHYQTTATGFRQLSSQTKFAHDDELDESLESPVVLEFTEVDGVLCADYRIVLEPEV